MTVCHDAASLFQLQWVLSALAPPIGTPVVISPLSTVLATAITQDPPFNVTASVRPRALMGTAVGSHHVTTMSRQCRGLSYYQS